MMPRRTTKEWPAGSAQTENDVEQQPTELHFAAQDGDLAEVRRLLTLGAEVNATDAHGNTPLKYASAEPWPEVLRLLIAYGASTTIADENGFTPMHCATGHGFYDEAIEMVETLLLAGADVNARSIHLGFVPLHEASTAQMVDWLLAHGADPTIRNTAGQTPEEYLRADGCIEEADRLSDWCRNSEPESKTK